MKQLIYIICLFAFSTIASRAEEAGKAYLKTQYEQWSILGKGTDKSYQKIDKFILQMGEGKSYYYDPQTYYVDSLVSTKNLGGH